MKRKMSLTKLYLGSMGAFVIGFTLLFISPIFTGKTYSYAEAPLNEYESFGNSIQISLARKEFNPEEKIIRLDFSLKEDSTSLDLQSLDLDIKTQTITGNNKLEINKTKVNEGYYVFFIENISKDFEVLSTTVTSIINKPELENEEQNETGSIKKFYVNETEEIINTDLKIGSLEEYKLENIVFEQDQTKEEIKKKEKDIKTNATLISEAKKIIKDLENDMRYQTEIEKFETQNKINGQKSNITAKEKNIEELQKEIEELNLKVDLLSDKKNDL